MTLSYARGRLSRNGGHRYTRCMERGTPIETGGLGGHATTHCQSKPAYEGLDVWEIKVAVGSNNLKGSWTKKLTRQVRYNKSMDA